MQETLRKHTPIPNLTRICTEPFTLEGTNLKLQKGDMVIIPTMGFHHDPKYFPNPDHFDPERFSEENKKLIPSYAYLPFGEGPRMCIGMRFGLVQAKVGLVGLLSRYKFSVCEKTDIPLVYDPVSLILTAKNGFHLTIIHGVRCSSRGMGRNTEHEPFHDGHLAKSVTTEQLTAHHGHKTPFTFPLTPPSFKACVSTPYFVIGLPGVATQRQFGESTRQVETRIDCDLETVS
ncbi:unnamed protein product [Timema podura]|uniref:Cytochrome P450 n=1 Tax=Timema podura TaxID=61482 RepID=A0ABN7PAS3_TIMPD|nr:unnamed protein product [Timema podura]